MGVISTIMPIISIVSAGVRLVSGLGAAASQRRAASQAAQNQQIAAQNRANAMRANALRIQQDAEYMKKRKQKELEALERKNRIDSAGRRNSAAASGFMVAGTSLERLLVSQEFEDEKKAANLAWDWDSRIVRKHDEFNLRWHEASVEEQNGALAAQSTYTNGMLEADATASSAFSSAFSSIGGGLSQAAPLWSSGSSSWNVGNDIVPIMDLS